MKIKILLSILAVTFGAFAEQKAPYSGSRIFWDINTKKTIFENGIYSRLIELNDGRLLAVAEGGGIQINFSSDKGKSWNARKQIIGNPDKVNYAVPDLIQLSDGTILIGFNPRPSAPYSVERKFGIRVMRSTDNGETWSAPIKVFDASHNGGEGCWEPSFLELPTGEIQCYFANEYPYASSNEQCISMCRSFDKGLTWSEPVTVSFRKGYRDGMPVPVLLNESNEIAVIIEDNGWTGREWKFAATTVRTSLDDNWNSGYVSASSRNRDMIFEITPASTTISAAPYLRVLPSGETVASFQGNYRRSTPVEDQYYDMFVVVGDKNAKNFKAQSAPFNVSTSEHAIWNSLSVIEDGTVVAVSSIGKAGGSNAIQMIKGYPISVVKANYDNNITIDGQKDMKESWTAKNASQIFMGNVSKNRSTFDFAYDNEYLYFTANVIDRTIINTGTDNDGVKLFLDANNVSGTQPENGMFNLFFDTDGTVKAQQGNTGHWDDIESSAIKYAVDINKSYYKIEAAIPWTFLNKANAPIKDRMAIALEVFDKQQYSRTQETIADVDNKASWTWVEFRLNENAGISESYISESNLTLRKEKGLINIISNKNILDTTLYTFDGRILHHAGNCGLSYDMPISEISGGGIIKVTFSDGDSEIRKIFF